MQHVRANYRNAQATSMHNRHASRMLLDNSVSALKQSIIKSKKIYENSKAFNTITHYEKMLAKRKG